MPRTIARCRVSNISLIEPPPFATPTLPKKPANVRKTMKEAMFGDSAVAAWNVVNKTRLTRKRGRRPKVSDMGARSSGPIPSMQTNPVCPTSTSCAVVPNSSATSSSAGAKMELARTQTKASMVISAVSTIFQWNGQSLAFSGSFSANLITSTLSPVLERLPRRGARSGAWYGGDIG
jgi:hypothetical protein